MLYIRHFYRRPQRAVILSLLVLLLGIILLGNFHNRTAGLSASSAAPAPPPPPPACVTPPSGLKAWYPGEGNANDIQGPTFENGSLNNGATASTPGEVGTAFSFDGSNDFVGVPNSSALEPTNTTVDLWVKSSSPGAAAYLVAKGAQGCSFASYSINNSGTGGGLAFDVVTTGSGFVRSPFSSAAVFDGNWHHVAGTYDGAFVRLYVDGTQVGSGTAATGPIQYGLATTNNLTLGRFNGTCVLSYAGMLDEVEIFGRALTIAEIQSIANAGSAGKCKCVTPPSGLKAWYQGEGNANDIQGPTFVNGSLNNGATASTAGKVGTAFSFDGTDDHVNVPNNSELEPTSITVDLWVKSSSPGSSAYLVAKGAQGCSFASYSFNNSGTGGGIAFDIVTTGSGFVRSPFSTAAVFDGNWHHVAGTYDGVTVRLYVDGAQIGSGTAATGAIQYGLSTSNNLTFGRFNNAGCPLSYGGMLDEIEIFDHALTIAEIQSIFNAGSFGKCSPSPPIGLAADLSILKDDGVTTVTAGSLLTYTITVANNGPSNAFGAKVNDIFPITGVTWTCTASSGASCLGISGSGDIINKSVNINAGNMVVFTATGTVPSLAPSMITNKATVTAPSFVPDPNLSNNTSTDIDFVVPPVIGVDLTLTPTSCSALIRGKTGSMQLRIGNNGPSTATGVMSTTTLPNTVDLCSTSSPFVGVSCISAVNFLGQTIVKCDLHTIASGGFKTVRINFRPRCTAPSPIVTSNTVWANEFELVPRNNSLGTSSNVTGTCSVPSPCTVPPGGICLP